MASEAVEHDERPRLIRAAEITTSRSIALAPTQPRPTFVEMRADLEQANPQIVRQAANAHARLKVKARK